MRRFGGPEGEKTAVHRLALPRCRCNTRACVDGDCRVYDSAGGRGACVGADNRLASHREGMGWVVPASAC